MLLGEAHRGSVTSMDEISFGKWYYDRFAPVYDWLSPDRYYSRARLYAIEQLLLQPQQTVLNVPCGTGQNFQYFQRYLAGSGRIIGVDLSSGMLAQAQGKIDKHEWANIELYTEDVRQLTPAWLADKVGNGQPVTVDAVLCDLGLSGFPDWQQVIDQLLTMLKPGGRFVVMDWYLEKVTLRGRFVEWIGKGEVTRPIYQYVADRVDNFQLEQSFNRGGVFVAAGDAMTQTSGQRRE